MDVIHGVLAGEVRLGPYSLAVAPTTGAVERSGPAVATPPLLPPMLGAGECSPSLASAVAHSLLARSSSSATAWGVFQRAILKLLSKSVESRYQSAGGLYADLHYCLRVAEGVI